MVLTPTSALGAVISILLQSTGHGPGLDAPSAPLTSSTPHVSYYVTQNPPLGVLHLLGFYVGVFSRPTFLLTRTWDVTVAMGTTRLQKVLALLAVATGCYRGRGPRNVRVFGRRVASSSSALPPGNAALCSLQAAAEGWGCYPINKGFCDLSTFCNS
ncbi:unnamed protein product [Boreogadus saida]